MASKKVGGEDKTKGISELCATTDIANPTKFLIFKHEGKNFQHRSLQKRYYGGFAKILAVFFQGQYFGASQFINICSNDEFSELLEAN